MIVGQPEVGLILTSAGIISQPREPMSVKGHFEQGLRVKTSILWEFRRYSASKSTGKDADYATKDPGIRREVSLPRIVDIIL